MKIIDISVPIHPKMHVYPGDQALSVMPTAQIAQGDPYNLTAITMSSHTGTHLDSPYHFVPQGAKVDELPLDLFMGRAWVCALENLRSIGAQDLAQQGIPDGVERLLIKTANSRLWQRQGFQESFVYLKPDAARWIVSRGIRLVGLDYLSVEEMGTPKPETHLTLLGAGVVILEGLNLSAVEPGSYTLVCFPLRIANGDGAPCRAVLLE